ncbi:hypothetical protein [Sorangium sp. So ce854]|uniref:hypothetical protein n=1 Tax=Sorangium sp. So ce854 TaxID=3133322 RepID=UPI003F63F10D
MGIDFTALLDHALSWDELYRLPEALDARFICPVGVLGACPDLEDEETSEMGYLIEHVSG